MFSQFVVAEGRKKHWAERMLTYRGTKKSFAKWCNKNVPKDRTKAKEQYESYVANLENYEPILMRKHMYVLNKCMSILQIPGRSKLNTKEDKVNAIINATVEEEPLTFQDLGFASLEDYERWRRLTLMSNIRNRLFLAADDDDIKELDMALANMIDINDEDKRAVLNFGHRGGETALHRACRLGHVGIVKRLLATPGIDAYKENDEGLTPLMIASIEGHDDVVEAFRGFIPTEPTRKGTTSHSMLSGNVEKLKHLVI